MGEKYDLGACRIERYIRRAEPSGIQHIVASKRVPITIGKVERYHRTYDEEYWRFKTFRAFLRYYNCKRPHQSLNYHFPAEVYFKELKDKSNN